MNTNLQFLQQDLMFTSFFSVVVFGQAKLLNVMLTYSTGLQIRGGKGYFSIDFFGILHWKLNWRVKISFAVWGFTADIQFMWWNLLFLVKKN